MKQHSGFTLFEIIVVMVILFILTTLTILTLTPHRRMVKTDDGAGAIYTVMRQARIQAITRRQFYGVVVNTASTEKTLILSNSTKSLTFPGQSISLVDMGTFAAKDDEEITLSKKLPADVIINAPATELPNPATAFLAPERSFPRIDFTASKPTFVCYFDPGGRAVNSADNTGTQEYTVFYFSSYDINLNKSPTLLRAITLYGATGGIKFWRFIPPKWASKVS